MRSRTMLLATALAMALPGFAQSYSSSSSTVTSSGSTVQQSTVVNANGGTSITGTTGDASLTAGATVDAAADRVLLEQIVAQLAADPAIQGAAIDVQVAGGRVTLNGETRDTNQAESAKGVAQSIAGAANVTSRLTTGRQ